MSLGLSTWDAISEEFWDPIGTTYQAGSQLWDDITGSNPSSDLAQNVLFGSVSQSQKQASINQCVQGVQHAGGTDTGQCSNLINGVLNQANAQPVSELSGVMIVALVAVGAFVVIDMLS